MRLAFLEESLKELAPLFTRCGPQREGTSYEPERENTSQSNHVDALILDFPAFWIIRNTFLLFISHPAYGILL